MKVFEEGGSAEVRRVESAKAVGALCSMIARKITLESEEDDEGSEGEEEEDKDDAPSEIPSESE
jgi:hypothetical protein